MSGPYGCTICVPGAQAARVILPPTATDRERIAALCNHVMQVHNGGPADAWSEAEVVYPQAIMAWVRELYD